MVLFSKLLCVYGSRYMVILPGSNKVPSNLKVALNSDYDIQQRIKSGLFVITDEPEVKEEVKVEEPVKESEVKTEETKPVSKGFKLGGIKK